MATAKKAKKRKHVGQKFSATEATVLALIAQSPELYERLLPRLSRLGRQVAADLVGQPGPRGAEARHTADAIREWAETN